MIEDVRIADAGYFPEPCAMWKGMRLPKPLSDEFMRAWSFDGLRVVASAGKYGGQESPCLILKEQVHTELP